MKAIIVQDLLWGDSGKGSIVDFLASKLPNSLVIRSSGGHQCGHNVVLPDGKSHCFSQFGAGTLAGVPTYIDRDVLINPISMINEAIHLDTFGIDPFKMLSIHPKCSITTHYHKYINRAIPCGSCGLGIGMTRYTDMHGCSIHIRDSHEEILDKLFRIRVLLEDYFYTKFPERGNFLDETGYNRLNIYEVAEELFDINEYVMNQGVGDTFEVACHGKDYLIFEGAQGMALNEYTGYNPLESTWGNVSPRNAIEFCQRLYIPYHMLGITRTYFTRHGGKLPFKEFEHRDLGNPVNQYQGEMKFYDWHKNTFDTFYKQVNPDSLAVNCCDERDNPELMQYNVSIIGKGRTRDDKVLVNKIEDWQYD